MSDKPTIEDSLLLCASDLQHSAIYDNHIEMQSCIRAVADRITALVSVIDGVGRTALAALKHPAVKPDMLVNGGALKLALNVLRRAGKNEVADELECTAQAGEYQPSSADMVMAALDTGEWGLERMRRQCATCTSQPGSKFTGQGLQKPSAQGAPMPVDPTPSLSYDTARCQGGADKLCDICLRFLAPGNPYRQAYMSPPASIKRGECASHIPQGVRNAS